MIEVFQERSYDANTGLPARIREDFLSVSDKLRLNTSWEAFVYRAQARWQGCLPPNDELLDSGLPIGSESIAADGIESIRLHLADSGPDGGGPNFSEYVSKELMPSKKTIQKAWKTWRKFLSGNLELNPYLVVCGNIGGGKTALATALTDCELLEVPKGSIFLSPEPWQGNPYIEEFYRLLVAAGGDISEIQMKTQSTFAALKWPLELETMARLPNQAVVQDVDRGQDYAYFFTQDSLKMTRPELARVYYQDSLQRKRFTPPYIEYPIVVYVWASLETEKERLGLRRREMEEQMPDGYLASMHLNFLQRAFASHQIGIPLLVVDGESSDFSLPSETNPAGGPDRKVVAQAVWAQVTEIHPRLVKDLRTKFVYV